MLEKDLTGLLLTDRAGGFLPGVPLGCSGMRDHVLRDPSRALKYPASRTSAFCERLPARAGAA
jgi:hypothetical protein